MEKCSNTRKYIFLKFYAPSFALVRHSPGGAPPIWKSLSYTYYKIYCLIQQTSYAIEL